MSAFLPSWAKRSAERVLSSHGILLVVTGLLLWGISHAEDDMEATESAPEARIWAPGEGDRFRVFPESADVLGSGGEFHVYMDAHSHPNAAASFSRFALGAGGALPEHRHETTEEIAYFVSGKGIARIYRDGEARDVPVGPGHVWYNPPNAWHAVRNTGEEPLVLVFASIPNSDEGLMSFFRKISVKPGEEPVALPPEEFERIAREHDMILRPADSDSGEQ